MHDCNPDCTRQEFAEYLRNTYGENEARRYLALPVLNPGVGAPRSKRQFVLKECAELLVQQLKANKQYRYRDLIEIAITAQICEVHEADNLVVSLTNYLKRRGQLIALKQSTKRYLYSKSEAK
jgi:hypothetical protein